MVTTARGQSNGNSTSSGKRTRKRASSSKSASVPRNAVQLLKQDHRNVEDLFSQFEKARTGDRKQALAEQICTALKVHTKIEEEIFYPAFREATGEEDLYQEAEIEHESAEELISKIESSSSNDERFDAQVKVLSHMIEHHVHEEEKRDGMFARAQSAEMDLKDLGQQMAVRKSELETKENGGKKGLLNSLLGT
jgi:hemerythrin superfamily protein